MSLRLPEEDMKQLKSLADNANLMPIDLVRAAVKAILKAAEANDGKIELPIHVRTKGEESAWARICNSIEGMNLFEDDDSLPDGYFNLVAAAAIYAEIASMPDKVHGDTAANALRRIEVVRAEIAARRAKKPTR
jgi:hypothetical protein